ncbi:branched-chain amino acid ABC transporter permease [Stigmatella aurantiaca]|uniref:Branched-chain amino acid ABC transporter, permease protein n=1 Tax=Stigmatella aurantiaca (strain DW4/3-1) TaxID=378806 RepID=Q09BF6_STIAD|nr:branched-chain amino acid ABC transporter permease [Stigmatella aurantiaca]ADO69039.1 Branched-chain amino acid ABC transporter, permease protein [Stigmatella aurantiaca DW4/3-1]EAU69038.1 branched-chain amino acid ABC transporter, permease protein [Stigmatella aurantiaca DW4/3-1]
MAQLLQHLINGLAAGTIYALVALGYTMVYGVLKLINFAHGDVMMVGVYMGYGTAYALGRQAQKSVLGVVLIFLVAMAGCALLGFLIERFAYRPLREKPRLTALITAIGISFALSYGFQLDIGFLPGAAPRAFPEIIQPSEWLIIGDRDVVVWNWQIMSLLIAVGLMVGLQYLVFKTRFGRAMRAVSYDHRVAALMGIPTDRIIAVTFMIGSGLAAGAGLLYAIKDTSVNPLMGLFVGLKAFVAAVIGGIGHVPGAVVGALMLGLVEEFVVGYVASTWRDAVAFGILIIVLLVRPGGLFGRVAAEKV